MKIERAQGDLLMRLKIAKKRTVFGRISKSPDCALQAGSEYKFGRI
jgi:hypothetical protein